METKWEWISNRLKELEYTELSELAKEIDNIMYSVYKPRKFTLYWKTYYKSLNNLYKIEETLSKKLSFIKTTSESWQSCLGCVISNRFCRKCKFGDIAGRCYHYIDTKWSIFMEKLRICQ